MGQSVIIPLTYWWKGAVDILSCRRRRVTNKSMKGWGKRTAKTPQLNARESTRSPDDHVT